MHQATLQYRVQTSRAGHLQLEQAFLDMGNLYNALHHHRRAATGGHKGQFSLQAQGKAITRLHQEDPQYSGYAMKLMQRVAKQYNNAWDAARKVGGRAGMKDPHRYRSLQLSEPGVAHLKLSADGRKAAIRVKGLPTLRFKPDFRLPPDQPRMITVVRKPRGLVANLCYNRKAGTPEPAPEHSVGIDPGRVWLVSASGSDGARMQVLGRDDSEHRRRTRRIRRKLQRQRDAAIEDGRARWVSQKSRDGGIKRRFRWNGKPSASYLRETARLRKVEQKRADSLRGLHHRVSTGLVRRYRTVCLEDTKTANMVRSARGTAEEPGKNVRQKAGLNREILSQSWYKFRLMLEYKCRWQERELVLVPAPYTSMSCPECGHAERGNRRSRGRFLCLSCGHLDDADLNAAENIRRRGTEVPASADDWAGRAAGDSYESASATSPAPAGGRAARENADQPAIAN